MESCIFIECPEAELEKRLLVRGETSGKSHCSSQSPHFMKSKLCLSPLFVITLCILGRSDDNIVSARKRFATYKESTLPVIEHFAQLQMLTKVQGVGSIEEVFGQLKGRFTKFIDPAWRQTMKH